MAQHQRARDTEAAELLPKEQQAARERDPDPDADGVCNGFSVKSRLQMSSEQLLKGREGSSKAVQSLTPTNRIKKLVFFSLIFSCLGLLATQKLAVHELLKHPVDLETAASVPLSLSPDINVVDEYARGGPSISMEGSERFLNVESPTKENLKEIVLPLKHIYGKSSVLQNAYITIDGKKFLRTPLLDAVWDYHESSAAQALIAQVRRK